MRRLRWLKSPFLGDQVGTPAKEHPCKCRGPLIATLPKRIDPTQVRVLPRQHVSSCHWDQTPDHPSSASKHTPSHGTHVAASQHTTCSVSGHATNPDLLRAQATDSQRGYYALVYKYVPDMVTKRDVARNGHLEHFQALVGGPWWQGFLGDVLRDLIKVHLARTLYHCDSFFLTKGCQ